VTHHFRMVEDSELLMKASQVDIRRLEIYIESLAKRIDKLERKRVHRRRKYIPVTEDDWDDWLRRQNG